MSEYFCRTEMLLGTEAMECLELAHVAVFGLGGVGGHAVEALARSGVGALTLIDGDTVSPSNLNRQLLATRSTIGRQKAEVMRERVLDINPDCRVEVRPCFFVPDSCGEFDFSAYSYVVDAVDMVTAKLLLIQMAQEKGVPVISSMGAGNKLDPTRFEVADIYDTSVCPLAKVMRRELKKRGISHLKVVYSREQPCVPQPCGLEEPAQGKRQIPGSLAYVPSAAGLILASEVVKDIINRQKGDM